MKISKINKEEIQKMYDSGMTIKQISSNIGFGERYIYENIELDKNRNKFRKKNIDVNEAQKLYDDGLPISKLAKHFGVSQTKILNLKLVVRSLSVANTLASKTRIQTDESKANQRKIMEDKGRWIPIKDISPYKLYYRESNWIERMIDYFDHSEKDNLKSYGIYNSKNPGGFVRDHIVPRIVGYEFQIPSYIIRHPSNCQFISHKENITKGFNDSKLTSNEKKMLIDSLLEKIEKFQGNWQEQSICLEYIIQNTADRYRHDLPKYLTINPRCDTIHL